MAKSLYYYCEKCFNQWEDEYDSEYGECDSECSCCGGDFSPYTNKQELNKAVKKNEKTLKVHKITITVCTNSKKTKKELQEELTNGFEKVLEAVDTTGLTKSLSDITFEK
jgi:hypothetical protein